MKNLILFLGAFGLGLLPGCGNYSNEDLVFYNALPDRQQLTSRAPDAGTGQDGASLRFGASRTSSANVGEHSTLDDGVTGWVVSANGIVYSVLDLLDAVTRLPPTTRKTHERIWGPAPAHDQPGFDVELVMDRADNHFTYRLELRSRREAGAAWVPILVGTFDAADGVRKGVGGFLLDAQAAHDHDIPLDSMDTLSRLQSDYDTRTAEPLSIALTVSYVASLHYPDFHYVYSEAPGEPTVMNVDGPLPDQGGRPFSVFGEWVSSGAGRATLKTYEATGAAQAEVTECWDSGALIRYQVVAGLGEAGDRTQCLPPLP